MKHTILAVVMITILAGCGDFEWFPDAKTSTSPNAPTSTSVSVATLTLADAPTDLPYSQSLSATGGTGTYAWAVTNGTLPAGLSLNNGGTISGTPTAVTNAAPAASVYTFTVTASDSSVPPLTAARNLTIFTPTTGRMSDTTGKVYAEGLTFDPSLGLKISDVKNTDSVAHTIQVTVVNYDNTGKVITGDGNPFSMSPITVPAGTTSPITNTNFVQFPVNNWRIKSVSITQ